jgi:aldehyde dehydrogenase (NAD+)
VTGKVITAVSAGSKKDVDIAVDAAKKAYKTSWGLKVPGAQRGRLLNKLADLMEKHAEEIAAIETLDVGEIELPFPRRRQLEKANTDPGKTYIMSRHVDVSSSLECLRYYAGWADKITGQTIEVCTPQ